MILDGTLNVLLLLVILVARPHGLVGDWELTWSGLRKKSERGE